MNIRKIDLMHKMFGKCEGHTCGECNNLIEGHYHDKKLRKCTVYGLTHSEASDWAKRYPACGKFNAEYDGTPIIKYVGKYRTLSGIVVDGQISMLMEDAMLIIRTMFNIRPVEVEQLRNSIEEQIKTGTVILPAYCEALYIPPDMDVKIKVLGKGEIG